MRRALFLFALAVSWLGAGGAHAIEPTAEPTAAQLAAAAQEQRFGGNVVEVWETDWQGLQLQLGMARRYTGGQPEVLLRVLQPHKYETLAFLLRQRKNEEPSATYYRSSKMFPPSRKTGRTLDAVVASWIERLPFVGGLPTLSDLWPRKLSDFTYARLPDETIENVKCQVFESRPKRPDAGFDRIVTVLTPDSHVALETRWLRGDKVVRLDRVGVKDIEKTEGGAIARRHEIVQGRDAPQIVVVGRFSLDPVLPDQLFTTSNLRIGRFPSY